MTAISELGLEGAGKEAGKEKKNCVVVLYYTVLRLDANVSLILVARTWERLLFESGLQFSDLCFNGDRSLVSENSFPVLEGSFWFGNSKDQLL